MLTAKFFAIVYNSNTGEIQRLHLPDSEPVTVLPRSANVHFDPATTTLGAVYSNVDNDADLHTITVETLCPEDWVD
ncbi:MAG: hypothetical protein AAGF11_37640 [Myxococcota bacterium]